MKRRSVHESARHWLLCHQDYLDIYHMRNPIGCQIINGRLFCFPPLSYKDISKQTGLDKKDILVICNKVKKKLIKFVFDKETFKNLYGAQKND